VQGADEILFTGDHIGLHRHMLRDEVRATGESIHSDACLSMEFLQLAHGDRRINTGIVLVRRHAPEVQLIHAVLPAKLCHEARNHPANSFRVECRASCEVDGREHLAELSLVVTLKQLVPNGFEPDSARSKEVGY
jgi:hypothetical protein